MVDGVMFCDGNKLSLRSDTPTGGPRNFEFGSEYCPKPKTYNIKINTFHWLKY